MLKVIKVTQDQLEKKEIEETGEFLVNLVQLDPLVLKDQQESQDCLVLMDSLVQRDKLVLLVHEDSQELLELMSVTKKNNKKKNRHIHAKIYKSFPLGC